MDTNDRRQNREHVRVHTLIENTAQDIFENLTRLRELRSVHGQRWIWELIQNAADAAGEEGNKVRVYSKDDLLRFSHNGAAFTIEEVSHLIHHGSTKQLDPTKKGKFGTGFLAVHLLADQVRVSGLLNEDGERERFQFDLDRSGNDAQEIERQMKAAWDAFNESVTAWSQTDDLEFTTTFECRVEVASRMIAHQGLSYLEKVAPYLLAFLDEINEIILEKDGITQSWRQPERPTSKDGVRHTSIWYTRGSDEDVYHIAEVGDRKLHVAIAVLLSFEGGRGRIIVDETTPRLFYPLPLVETHNVPLPFAVVSERFHPTPERDGLYAKEAPSSDDTAKYTRLNWELLKVVPTLFPRLAEAACLLGWANIHKLAKLGKTLESQWLNSEWFNSRVTKPMVDYLRSPSAPNLVLARTGEMIPVNNALIPKEGLLGSFYDLAKPSRRRALDFLTQSWWMSGG